MRVQFLFGFVLLSICCSSCSSLFTNKVVTQNTVGKEFHVELHESMPHSAPVNFQAGAAEIDITPWAGISMGGFGPLAKDARGFGLRLYAKAFYFEDTHGNALAFISADLWSMPAGLADSVASILAHDPATSHLGRSRILFSATHNHQSPGGFSSSVQYNTFASNWPYVNPQLFQFLARRIAQVISLAYSRREAATISFGKSSVAEVARNRSMPALRNDMPSEISQLISAHKDFSYDQQTPADFKDPDCYRAVDPTLSALVIRSHASSNILGIAVFFACHPISMGAKPPVYSSDFFGYAETQMKNALPEKPVVAMFNGAEGDVTSNYYDESWEDCRRLGNTLFNAINNTVRQSQRFSLNDLSSHYEILPISGACIANDCAANVAVLGAKALGGSEEGRMYDFVSKLSDTTGCFEYSMATGPVSNIAGQPPKIPAQSKLPTLQKLAMNFATPFVPKIIPLGIYRIGDINIFSLPGEFSTMLGYRLKEELKNLPLFKDKTILFAGLSNEYLSYFTTPEEYDMQQYEGASMLYGRLAGKIVSETIIQAAERFDSAIHLPSDAIYRPGVSKSIDADRLKTPADPMKELACFLTPQRRYVRIDWMDQALRIPNNDEIFSARINPEVTFYNGHDSITNISSTDIITFVRSANDKKSDWSAFWLLPSELQIAVGTEISAKVETLSGEEKKISGKVSDVR